MDWRGGRPESLPSFKASWSSIDRAADPAAFVRFLERFGGATTDDPRAYDPLAALLQPGPGQRILDVGCGLGGATRALALRVGTDGRAVGVDNSATIIAAARRVAVRRLPVAYAVADAHSLPVADATFDGGCSLGTVEILADPRRALAELVRAVRPGGRVVVGGPDLGSTVIDADDRALTRRLLDFICDHETNGWIGRQLPGLCREAGLVDIAVEPSSWVVTDYALATDVWLGRHLARAQATGAVSPAEATAWQADLTRRAAAGRFFLARTAFLVAGRKP